MSNNQFFVAVTVADAPVAIMGIVIEGRGSILPSDAKWIGDGRWMRAPTDAVVFEEISRAFAGKTVLSYRRILPSDIPEDRTYRNAWVDAGAKIDHDMPKARALHLDKLRRARVGALEALDVELLKAVGRGAKLDTIEAKKQALRDMPQWLAPALDACKTIDELKQITF